MAWRPTRVNPRSIWQVSIFEYRRKGIERHGWRIYSHGRLVAKRTGFATWQAAEESLTTMTLLLSEWRRQLLRRRRVAAGGRS